MTFKKSLPFFLIALFAIIIVSCTDNITGPADDTRTPGKPDSAKATTKNDSTILIKWKKSIDEKDTAFVGYIIKMTGDDNSTKIDTVKASFNPLQVTGLKAGVIYTFDICALFKNGKKSASTNISWSPAYRFTKNGAGSIIKLYETSSRLGSGIDAYDVASKAPKTLSVAHAEDWTLGLDTRNGKVIIASPSKINYKYTGTPGVTEISEYVYIDNELNDTYDSQVLNNAKANFAVRADTLTNYTNLIKKGLVIILRTKEAGENDWHYAKVLVKKDEKNNKWLRGTSPNRYVEVEISYQTKASVPYAKANIR